MAFDQAKFSYAGKAALAAAAAGGTISINRILLDEAEHNIDNIEQSAQWWDNDTSATMRRLNAEVILAGLIDNEARIRIKISLKPAATSTKNVRTIVVIANLVNAGVASPDFVLCGAVDDRGIDIVKSNSDIKRSTAVSLYFKLDDAENITISTLDNPDFVAPDDLKRFVSCFKAGDPTTGEAQNILGAKTFENATTFSDRVTCSSNVTINGTCTCNGPLYSNKAYLDVIYAKSRSTSTCGTASAPFNAIYTENLRTPSTITNMGVQCNLIPVSNSTYSLGDSMHRWSAMYSVVANANNVITDDLTGRVGNSYNIRATNIVPANATVHTLGTDDTRWNVVYASTVDAVNILPSTTGSSEKNIGSSAQRFDNVYAKNIKGMLPAPSYNQSNGVVSMEAGAICLGLQVTAQDGDFMVGQNLRVSANQWMFCDFEGAAIPSGVSVKYLPAGTYRVLSCYFRGTRVPVLLMYVGGLS